MTGHTGTDPLELLDLDRAVPCSSSRLDEPWIVHLLGRQLLVPRQLLDVLRLHHKGADIPEIASRVAAPAAAISAALDRTRRRITEIVDRPDRVSGHVIRRDVLSARLAGRLASRLRGLMKGWTALAIAAISLAVVVLALIWKPSVSVTAANFWGGYGLVLLLLLAHELGHAAACAANGVRPGPIGVTIYLVFPAFYADVSSAWVLTRRQRLRVDIGGVQLQLLATAMIALAAVLTGSDILQAGVLFSVGTVAMTLNPVLKMDGYWLLADALGVPNLAGQVRQRLVRVWRPDHSSPGTKWPPGIAIALTVYTAVSVVVLAGFALYVVPWLTRCVLRVIPLLEEAARHPSLLASPRLFEVLMTAYGAVLAGVLTTRGLRAGVRVLRQRAR